MNLKPESITQRGGAFLPWIIRKIAPALFVGGIVGCTIGLLVTHNAPLLRVLSIVAAVLFAVCSIIYFYWASCPANGGGYKWLVLERVGIMVSGLAALVMSSKLALSDILPGSHFAYLVCALILAFVVRPILDSSGFRKNNCKQGSAGQPATSSESK